MQETLKMMKSILTGKEKESDEKELINKYKEKLLPNILACFYCNNFGVIYKTSKLYPIITDDDKASFCLQELDKCLQNFDFNKHNKFITYFLICYKNRLRMETEQLLTQKRKAILNSNSIEAENIEIEKELVVDDIDYILDNYNLTDIEKKQCKLLDMGYNLKEIAKLLNKATITIYKRNSIIKQKILDSDINFV